MLANMTLHGAECSRGASNCNVASALEYARVEKQRIIIFMTEKMRSMNKVPDGVERLFNNVVPDAIVIPSADIKEDPKSPSGYASPSYDDVDIRKLMSGGKARVIGAAEAMKHFPNTVAVTSSRDRVSRNRPTHASVYADELIELGVPRDHIVLQEKSVNSITEIVETIKLAAARKWWKIAFVSNDYQLSRIQTMYEHITDLADPGDAEFIDALDTFKKSNGAILYVSAERLLVVRRPLYGRLVQKAKGTLAYHVRDLNERRGEHDVRTGKYDVKRSKEV